MPSGLHRTYSAYHLHFYHSVCATAGLAPGASLRETKKRVEKLRYMHCNPLKRALVESSEPWGWSSFRFYLLGEAGPVRNK